MCCFRGFYGGCCVCCACCVVAFAVGRGDCDDGILNVAFPVGCDIVLVGFVGV